MKSSWFIKHKWPITIISIIILYCFLGFNEVLFYRPISIHQSAQCSRASIALNYYEEGMNFFVPKVHDTRNTSGITGTEFPLMNYAAAICYTIFGFHEFWYRFLMLLSITLGLIFSIKIANIHIENFAISSLIGIIWYLSPILVYYSPNFNPDTASLGFVMMGWYFFFKYLKERKSKHIYLWTFFVSLAGLVKVVSLISVVAVFGIIFLDLIKYLDTKIDNKHKILFIIGNFIAILLVIAWYKYARFLMETSGNAQFSLRPHSPKSWETAKSVWATIKWQWYPFYYNKTLYSILGIGTLLMIVFHKSTSRLLATITILLYIGAICFIGLMLPQFKNHDYYIITLLPAIFFHLLAFNQIIFKKVEIKHKSKVIVLALSALAIHSAIHAKEHQLTRYGGMYYSWEVDYSAYYNMEEKIRAIGINREEKFVTYDDWTPNNTLYLIDQKGWTIAEWEHHLLPKALEDSKYALLKKFDILNKKNIAPNFNKPIAVFDKQIVLFEITHTDTIFYKEKVWDQIDSLKEVNKKVIYCDMETISSNGDTIFSSDTNIFFTNLKLSKTKSHSGEHSIFIDSTDEALLHFNIPQNYKYFEVSVQSTCPDKKAFLILSSNKKGFYKGQNIEDLTDSLGWNRLSVNGSRGFFNQEQKFSIFIHNPKKQRFYIDDLVLKVWN